MRRLAVYTIAKNEAENVEGFMSTAKEADYVLVADTGSKDDTVQRLKDAGAHVHQIQVRPWRFDRARNRAMALVPACHEILFSLDLDERIEPGWAAIVKKAWTKDVNQLTYREVFSHRADGSPGKVLPKRKIHNRDFRWRCPVHEVLTTRKGKVARMADCPIEVHHYPKSKDRNGYLPLLKLGVEEDPADDRLAHYFARELWYKGEHRRAIAEFHRHLALPSAKWVPERAASMVFMAHCHQALGKPELARGWLLRACAEDPESREPWLEFANFCLAGKDMAGAYWGARRALEITRRTGAYTEHERSWREGPHDVLSVAAWYLGHRKEALKHVNIAISLAPFDQRICRNHAMMEGIEAGQ